MQHVQGKLLHVMAYNPKPDDDYCTSPALDNDQ